jgi:hypothetical protein
MAITAQQELDALETGYLAWLAAGAPTSYTMNGQTVTRDPKWWTDRIDLLRAQVARETRGTFFASQFRPAE